VRSYLWARPNCLRAFSFPGVVWHLVDLAGKECGALKTLLTAFMKASLCTSRRQMRPSAMVQRTYPLCCFTKHTSYKKRSTECRGPIFTFGRSRVQITILNNICLNPSNQVLGYYLKLCHYRFLPYSFQISIH
jgi:hypothetical protein